MKKKRLADHEEPRHKQGLMSFPNGWGGRRKRAGRKPKGSRAGVSHRERPFLSSRSPVHVTMKCAAGLPSLRRVEARRCLLRAFAASNAKGRVRITHYSIQSNHMHLLVEAEDREALSRGLQGLSIRIARGLNRWWKRTGKVFADRFHAHILESPREVRNAIRYVLQNARHHGLRLLSIDPYSSGEDFNGWKGDSRKGPGVHAENCARDALGLPVLTPRTWLLSDGWKLHGLLDPTESPS